MFVGIVISIHFACEKYLPAVADTLDGMSLLLCFAQCWQQHTSQNCNNRDDDQQFNESKTAFPAQPVSRRHRPPLSGTHSNVEFETTIAIFMTARGNRSNPGAENNGLYPSKPSSQVIHIISRTGSQLHVSAIRGVLSRSRYFGVFYRASENLSQT